jgi:hypothetical protein
MATYEWNYPTGGVAVNGPSGGGLLVRKTTTYTSSAITAGFTILESVNIAKSYRLLSIAISNPAWIRLYSTVQKQSDDFNSGRTIDSDPVGDHGVMFEYISTPSLLGSDLSPTVDGFNGESPPTNVIPITVTNLDTSPAVVTVVFEWIETE